MKTDKAGRKPFFIIMIILGLAALTGAAILVIGEIAKKPDLPPKEEILSALEEIMPPTRQKGIKEDRYNPEMPVYSYKGTDYIGILTEDSMNIKEPVLSDWNRKALDIFPCRYSGNTYDGTLIIGGANSASVFRFIENLDPGDRVKLTDVRGNVFEYEVTVVKHAKKADMSTLSDSESDLVIYTESSHNSGYVIARCRIR